MKIKNYFNMRRLSMMLLLALCSHLMWSQSDVFLTSDQSDYMAGTTVTLSGNGFFPGETVSIVVNHVGVGDDLTSPAHQPFTVLADGSGQITAQWLVPLDEDEVGAALVATATGLSSNLVAQALFTDNVKVDFRQSANKDAGLPPGAIHWINSILQQSNSFYQEGMSSLQRVILDDIAPTTGNIHTLKFRHLYTKGGHHAYDFITGNSPNAPVGWNVALADYNPLLYADPVTIIEAYQCEQDIEGGLSGTCANLHSPGAFYYDVELPNDSYIGVHGPVQSKIDAYESESGNRFIRLYGDSAITNAYISCLQHDVPNLGDDGDSYISYVLVAATKSTALSVEMGAHLAIGGQDNSGMHWGSNLGAGSINGGPYHFRLDQLGGAIDPTTCAMTEVVSLGAQDNQIKSGDIIPLTCECAISGAVGPVCPGSSNQYCAPDGTVTSVWSISGNGTISGFGTCISVIAGSVCGQSYTLTLTATNTDGCTISCDITEMVSDTIAPIVTASGSVPNNSNLGCNPTAAQISAALGTANATDDCGSATVTYGDSGISTSGCDQSQTRTFAAIDLCGNTASTSRTISWNVDLVAPVITATGSVENNANLGCNPTDAQINAALGTASAQDNCDGIRPVTATDGSVSPDGCTRTQTRNFSSSDICGNSSSVSRSISWKVDLVAPVIVTTASVENNANLGCNPTADEIDAALGTAIAQDICDGELPVAISDGYIFSDGCTRTQTRSFYSEDICGNSSSVSRTISWKVDLVAPVIVTTASVENNANLGCNPSVAEIEAALGYAVSQDNCDGSLNVVVTNGSISTDDCMRTQTRSFYSEDICGNSSSDSRTISWKVDLVAPVITTTGSVDNNTNLGCNPSADEIDAALGYAAAQDNCDGSRNVVVTDGSISSDGCTRTQTRIFYSEDICGNSSSDSRTISWKEDTTNPMVEVEPLSITIECGSAVPTYTPIWTDNCDQSLTLSAISAIIHTDCSDIIDQKWFAVDQCGNEASVSRSITIVDTTPPTIVCPAAVQVDCAQNVPAPDTALVVASDVCDNSVDVSWVGDAVSNQICANRYTITRSYSATDDCGNTSICAQLILVNDDLAPVISVCPNNATVSCAAEVPAPNVNLVIATDGCDGEVAITVDGDVISNQTCANRYTISRTYRATDGCGNFSTCTQTITVYDNTLPTITCPQNILAGDCNSTGICNATAFDNCTNAPVHVSYNYACNYDFPVGSTQVVATAIDDCGNSASCNFTVTIAANPVCSLTAPAILPTAGSVGNSLCVAANANYSYAWTVSGAGWAITNGANSNCITYTAGAMGVSGTFCLTITNQYNCSSTCCVTFQSLGQQFCTYTQGFYGGNGKNCSGLKPLQVINQALANGGNLVIGTPATNRSLTILAAEGSCLAGKMPAGTTPAMLPLGQVTCATATGSNYLSGGRFISVLVGQTLALGLNLRNSSNLASLVLYGSQFTTAKASACTSGTVVAGSELTFCVPINVYNYLSAPKTVAKLYTLANQALGGNTPAGMTISDINAAVDAINKGFDQCRILVSFGNCTRSVETQAGDENVNVIHAFGEQLKLTSYPNPMSDDAIIEFSSEQDIKGSLELYSSTGELVTTIFSGDLKGGETRLVRFNASELASGIYICKLSAGDKVQYNKILVSK